jgi:hypothetical protein
MNTPTEIKAGQRWASIVDGYQLVIEWTDKHQVLYRCNLISYGRAALLSVDVFLQHFEPVPEPKTRPITWSDVLKLLSEHGHCWARTGFFDRGEFHDWQVLLGKQMFDEMEDDGIDNWQFSHNPFAPNAEIIGPMVPEGVGE